MLALTPGRMEGSPLGVLKKFRIGKAIVQAACVVGGRREGNAMIMMGQ